MIKPVACVVIEIDKRSAKKRQGLKSLCGMVDSMLPSNSTTTIPDWHIAAAQLDDMTLFGAPQRPDLIASAREFLQITSEAVRPLNVAEFLPLLYRAATTGWASLTGKAVQFLVEAEVGDRRQKNAELLLPQYIEAMNAAGIALPQWLIEYGVLYGGPGSVDAFVSTGSEKTLFDLVRLYLTEYIQQVKPVDKKAFNAALQKRTDRFHGKTVDDLIEMPQPKDEV